MDRPLGGRAGVTHRLREITGRCWRSLVAVDRHPLHVASIGEVIADRVMLGHAVIPDRHRVVLRRPLESFQRVKPKGALFPIAVFEELERWGYFSIIKVTGSAAKKQEQIAEFCTKGKCEILLITYVIYVLLTYRITHSSHHSLIATI